jgi:hypothetical protein
MGVTTGEVMDVPERWRAYPCDDYFHGGRSEGGFYDEQSQLLGIVPLAEAYEDVSHKFFAVGRSGCDGIDFGYRKDQSGLWAFYPIEQEFKFLAATVTQLVEEWRSGRLSV